MVGIPAEGHTEQAPREFVLDSSVTLAWYFKDEWNEYADAVRDRMDRTRAFVPTVWPLEIANVLRVGECRGRSTAAQAAKWVSILGALPVVIDESTSERDFDANLSLARALNLSCYDASYLELAMRRGLPLATLDDRLKAASAAVGVPLYAVATNV
jgi:predicted nucleic acid-binding protein